MMTIKARQGTSLLEVTIGSAVSVTLIVLAIGWIHQSLLLAKTVKQKQQQQTQIQRLADQVRLDIRLAGQATAVSPQQMVMTGPTLGTVTYKIVGANVERTQHAVGPGIPHRDHYRLAPGSQIAWDPSELPAWCTLTVKRGLGLPSRSGDVPAVAEKEAVPAVVMTSRPPLDLRVRGQVGRWLTATVLAADQEEP